MYSFFGTEVFLGYGCAPFPNHFGDVYPLIADFETSGGVVLWDLFMLPESVAQGHYRPLRPLTASSEKLF